MSNFEDEQKEVKSQGTSTVKSGSPVLWLKNRNKKSDKKVQVDNKPLKIEIKVVLPRDIYKFGELIVKNNFCKINRGLNILNGETIVIKSYTDNKYLTSQINILKNLNHTNIIKLIDNDESNIYIEYISGGSLKSLIEKYGNLSETLIEKYTRQTVAGLAYLHSKSIVHNNLKLSNILIDTNGVVKLNDFSEAKSFSVDEHFRTQSDYQSLVYIILEMLCEDVNINYEEISTNCKDFINTLFKIIPDPLKLLEHPFLN
jgi:serine/threonine protein kinase